MPNPYVLQCVWPIVDESYTRSELIAEATQLIDDMASEADAVIVGPAVWSIHNASAVPGWKDYPGSVLIAQAPAEPAPARRRWAPRSDIDQIAVERAVRGDRSVSLGPAERRAAVRLAAERHRFSDQQIAARIGLTPRSILRIRQDNGIPAGVSIGQAA